MTKLSRSDLIGLAGLGTAWVGVWAAWIPHRTASLTQNAIDLADWSAYLLDVRFGPLGLTPDILRLAVALGMVALAVGAGVLRQRWLRWAVRLVAVLPGLVLLPPYPFVLELWRSETYGIRFVAAAVLWAGVAASGLADLASLRIRRGLTLALSAAAAACGVGAFLALRLPFEAHYARPLLPGWGMLAFGSGLAAAAGIQVIALWRGRKKPNGSEH